MNYSKLFQISFRFCEVKNVLNSILEAVVLDTKELGHVWDFDDEEIKLDGEWFSCSGRCHTLYDPSSATINRELWKNYYCWCPVDDKNQWLQITFPETHRVSGIAIQVM